MNGGNDNYLKFEGGFDGNYPMISSTVRNHICYLAQIMNANIS